METVVYEDTLDENGNLCYDVYVDYFSNNIQKQITLDNGEVHYEGEMANEIFYNKDILEIFKAPITIIEQQKVEGKKYTDPVKKQVTLYEKWVKDETLNGLFKELRMNGMKICSINFLLLCKYINAVIREGFFILLKPTIKDTVSELDEVKLISFTNKDGKKIDSNNTELITKVMECLVESSKFYEAFRMVRMDEYLDKSELQSKFAYYTASFLQSYFKDYPRRKNCCMVSMEEQRLILHLLSFFELSEKPLSDSRFRQLISYEKNNKHSLSWSTFPNLGSLPMEFVKYKDWKEGSVKFDKMDKLKKDERISFCKNFEISVNLNDLF